MYEIIARALARNIELKENLIKEREKLLNAETPEEIKRCEENIDFILDSREINNFIIMQAKKLGHEKLN